MQSSLALQLIYPRHAPVMKNNKTRMSKAVNYAKSSAEIVASVDDLLTQLLLRLPIKSLTRFKLVSKYWYSIITDPGFCSRRNPNPNPAIGLFLPSTNFRRNTRYEYVPFSVNNEPNKPPFRKLVFSKETSRVRILQSCNGLLLCCTSQARDWKRRHYVYNPTTKKVSMLPKLERGDGISMNVSGMGLAFDPIKSPHYKVVCVRGLELAVGEWQYHIEVYSSDQAGGHWKKRGEPFTADDVNFKNGVYWENAIHWINEGNDVTDDSLYFNPNDDQTVRIMPTPPPTPDGWAYRRNYYFGESCDHLHYAEVDHADIEFNVYEMRKDYSEWFVKYRVDLSLVLAENPGMVWDSFILNEWYNYAFSIFCVVRGEEEEDSFLVLQIPGKIIRYNLVSMAFETLHEFECDENEVECDEDEGLRYEGVSGFQYIESLCCV